MAPLALLLAACALAAPLHAASLAAPSLAPPAHAIPVPVLLDAEPSLNELDDVEIERPAPDLRNPGPPQRQEHDSQAPERHSADHLDLSAIRESIERTRDSLAQSLRDTSANVQSWLADPRDQTDILTSVHRLRDTFSTQIQKLSDTIHSRAKPEEITLVQSERNVVNVIESKLENLKDDFNNGIETLSQGLKLAVRLKSNVGDEKAEEGSSSSASESSSSSPIGGNIVNFLNTFFGSVMASFSSLFNPFQTQLPSGAQSDVSSGPVAFRPPIIISSLISSIVQAAGSATGPVEEIGSVVGDTVESVTHIASEDEKPEAVAETIPQASGQDAAGGTQPAAVNLTGDSIDSIEPSEQKPQEINESIEPSEQKPEEVNETNNEVLEIIREETQKDKEVDFKSKPAADKTE